MTDDARGRLKRRGPRVVGPFKARWCGALTVPLVVHDLSVGGCLILSSKTTLPDKHMTIDIDLPGGDSIRVQAQPLYIRTGVGFVVKFINVPAETDLRLQRVVAALSAAAQKRSET